ncbi:hypothetical protein D9757_010822 [Collybiopsis confluens]|uniref:Uncharacterized protein n=1 Tax=Collybiopsis confluens TaxID=2823264 RepID=A0A8H5GUB5_9AGAR|nr:hypothetical protein D9757_010822 [Collybiopsis confluens]
MRFWFTMFSWIDSDLFWVFVAILQDILDFYSNAQFLESETQLCRETLCKSDESYTINLENLDTEVAASTTVVSGCTSRYLHFTAAYV